MERQAIPGAILKASIHQSSSPSVQPFLAKWCPNHVEGEVAHPIQITLVNFKKYLQVVGIHGLVATIVIRQIVNEDKNLSQQIHEDKRQKDKC